VLLDRDAQLLRVVVERIRAAHPRLAVAEVVADLGDDAAAREVGARLAAAHPETTLLVNNAGVALGGGFEQLSLEEFNWLIDINFRAVVTLTHYLLPVLRTNPGSHLANVSSVFGIIAPAGQSAYSASKFAVRGFTEVLRHELADEVGVTCIHPGGIATRIAESARIGADVDPADVAPGRAQMDALLTIPPPVAAEAILRGIERRRPRVLIGWTAKVPDLVARLAPGSYGAVLAALANRRGVAPRGAAALTHPTGLRG
jgi:short-subunit dehydrogenase